MLGAVSACDGRGVVVGILDSGVDPGAAGLAVCPDGRPKVVDVVDCTGDGDVRTTTKREAGADGSFLSADGRRRLVPGGEWSNPGGEWRVGQRPLFSFFTSPLRRRVRAERRKRFDEAHRPACAKASDELAAFDAAHKAPLGDEDARARAELVERIAQLEAFSDTEAAGVDEGPMVDAVVWQDSEGVWRAALDTSAIEGGSKLADSPALASFRRERKWGTFSTLDACNYALNVYEDGDVLSVVTDCSPHGTHVAGIVAAHHPGGDGALDGVAPGAQIVSLKIGDQRMGSMETGCGLYRALKAAVDNKCDLVNMSYGEPTSESNHGRFVQLAGELVNKHGIIFVSSAGNNGPGLSTVGAPGGSSSPILGIGAWVNPDMAAESHSVIEAETCGGRQYTWSSRGPTFDGDVGVDISAPGGAIAPVPEWTLNAKQLMNGTSMSSPNACGGMALLVGALKASGMPVTPARVRRAVLNTATQLSDLPHADQRLTAGRGLVDVSGAWDYLVSNEAADVPDVRYEVSVSYSNSLSRKMRGVYLRRVRGDPAYARVAAVVGVRPTFLEDARNKEDKAAFEQRIELTVEGRGGASVGWVQAPKGVMLMQGGRDFKIEVDTTQLPEDADLHFAEVVGRDSAAPERGPLFRVPVTVVEAAAVGVTATPAPYLARFEGVQLASGAVERRFVMPPAGSNFVEVTVAAGELPASPRSIWLHLVQVQGEERYSNLEVNKRLALTSHGKASATLAVREGCVLEVCVAQFWSSAGATTVDLEVDFHGLSAATGAQNAVAIVAGEGYGAVRVKSALRTERLNPSAKLDRLQSTLRPKKAELAPLRDAERDSLWEGKRSHGLTLEYSLSVKEKDGATVAVRMPAINKRVYDGPLDHQLYYIVDKYHRVVGEGDIYPEDHKLSKGEYTVRVLLRHDSPEVLRKLETTPLVLDRKLDTAVELGVYERLNDLALHRDSAKAKAKSLLKGECRPLFLAAADDEKMPKGAEAGDVLKGKLTLGAKSPAVPVTYVVCPKAEDLDKKKGEKKTDADKGKEKKDAATKLQEAARDAQMSALKKLPRGTHEERAEYDMALSVLLTQFPDHLPLLVQQCKTQKEVADNADETDKVVAMDAAVSAADGVIAAVDTAELALALGVRASDEDDEAAAGARKKAEEKRDALVDALACKASGVLGGSMAEGARAAEAAAIYKELAKWTDATAAKHAELRAAVEAARGRPAVAIKALGEHIKAEQPARELYERRAALLEDLGWAHIAACERERIALRFPGEAKLM